MTIKIQGTIVSPDYDDAFFGAWIDKGVITPSSRVVSAIEGAEEPIDLYINSYGGDVFAGGEMMIALVKAQAAGKLRTVEVGSLAASMAANIVAALKANGGKVTAHANTQLMYHGCYTVAEGGAQHLEDTAESLRSINEAVISNLNRIGITECRAWFAEGREKWLDASEARKLGIVDEVAEDGAENPPEMRQTAARLAALATHFTTRQEYKLMIENPSSRSRKNPRPHPKRLPSRSPSPKSRPPRPRRRSPPNPSMSRNLLPQRKRPRRRRRRLRSACRSSCRSASPCSSPRATRRFQTSRKSATPHAQTLRPRRRKRPVCAPKSKSSTLPSSFRFPQAHVSMLTTHTS